MIKNKNRGGFIDRQRKGVGVEEEKIDAPHSFSRSPMFSKRNERIHLPRGLPGPEL